MKMNGKKKLTCSFLPGALPNDAHSLSLLETHVSQKLGKSVTLKWTWVGKDPSNQGQMGSFNNVEDMRKKLDIKKRSQVILTITGDSGQVVVKGVTEVNDTDL